MGRTNIVLDDALVSRALKLTGLRSIREVVDYALRELIRHKRQQTLLELKGKVSWKGDLRRLRRKRAF